ncbi:MAG TPA: CPBP family intramembrane metalloprotease [Anaerolineae bacterium]|nr:CPBP family intramembrane metalloprotease [Anaerolineae bacterium]
MISTDSKTSKFALIALFALFISKLSVVLLFRIFSHQDPILDPLLDLHGLIFAWIMPLLIVYLIERNDYRSVGLVVERKDRMKYLCYVIAGLFIPGLIVGFGKELIGSLFQQLIAIGVAEEVFWRGYLQARLSAWLGKYQGWVITSTLFGFGHLVSLYSHPGVIPEMSDLMLLIQTTAGGFVLGYIYLRAKSIIPGSIFHVFGNIYLFQLIDLVTG